MPGLTKGRLPQVVVILSHAHSYPYVFGSAAQPFDDWDWIYEIKHDGFRALAVIEHGQCRFFSRKKHKLTGYQDLRQALVKEVNAETAILDGELVVVDHLGRTSLPT